MLTFNGQIFNADAFEQAIQEKLAEAFVADVREKFGSVRHPDTGEFPTIVARGKTLDTLKIAIEASQPLLALIRERMGSDEAKVIDLMDNAQPKTLKVFLSYSFEDRAVAEVIAEGFQAQGIDTWWAEWCMSSGDSLRRKIDDGLGNCTHFVVLLTPISITRPWVNQEMDAGLVRTLSEKCKFIPLRHNLPARELPPLLSGLLSPEVDAKVSNLQQLINEIHGITRKPPLGTPRIAEVDRATDTGYSPAANVLAKLFVETSEHGTSHEPQLTVEALVEKTGLSEEDIKDACFELSAFLEVFLYDTVWPNEALFSEFDRHWMPWDPASDALKLAGDMVNDASFPSTSSEIAQRYGWPPRRLNPAVTHLIERDAAEGSEVIGQPEFVTYRITKKDATRRFVRSRSI